MNTSVHASSPASTSMFGLATWHDYHYYFGHVMWDIEAFAVPPLMAWPPPLPPLDWLLPLPLDPHPAAATARAAMAATPARRSLRPRIMGLLLAGAYDVRTFG